MIATREPSNRCKRASAKAAAVATIRCAIYTRKSSEDGLQQEFNSLDAQREAAEAYLASQQHEGWVCLPDRYDDGGYTGGNMDRPALQRLLADIEAERIDCVAVYKVDRISRSLLDFARMMETFDKHQVSFVSVTQHFNTGTPMGRLILNVLLSFAQFEREIIGERIRDKIAASRQKGRWTGGTPILGYDVDRSTGSPKLVVNTVEAARVRQIFDMYLEHGTLLTVVAELDRRGWRSKAWSTRSGKRRGGLPIDKCGLHNLLTNVLYVGKIRHKQEVYVGAHEAIVPGDLFARVQTRLQQNRNAGSVELRNRHGAILRGLLCCKACGRAMTHTFASRGPKRYRYYTCTNAIKNGRAKCPTGSLPAGEIENAVVDQIRVIGEDPALLAETLQESRAQAGAAIEHLTTERHAVERSLAQCHADIRRVATSEPATSATSVRIADLHDQIGELERRLTEIDSQIAGHEGDLITDGEVATALRGFDGVWAALSPKEQTRLINLLISRVEFDARETTIAISFHASGIKALASGGDAANAAVEDAA